MFTFSVLLANNPPRGILFLNGDTVDGGYFGGKNIETLCKEAPQLFGNPTAADAEKLLKTVREFPADAAELRISGSGRFPKVTSPYVLLEVAEGDGMINGYSVKAGTRMLLPCGFEESRVSGEMKVRIAEHEK